MSTPLLSANAYQDLLNLALVDDDVDRPPSPPASELAMAGRDVSPADAGFFVEWEVVPPSAS